MAKIYPENHYDVIVLGGGVAGLSASLYTSRDDLSTLVVEGEFVSNTEVPGGALMLTESIENYPGYTGVAGEKLIEDMRKQSESFGVVFVDGLAVKIDTSINESGFSSVDISNFGSAPETYYGRTIIIATGAVSKKLGIPGEDEFYGHGVSTCATCDGYFYTGKVVGVVGGGDTAVEDALYLTRYAKKVHLYVRGEKLRTNSPEARKLLAHDDVIVHWNSKIASISGSTENEDMVGSVEVVTPDGSHNDALDGVFVAIGRSPNTSFLAESAIRLDTTGYIVVSGGGHAESRTESTLPHVFAVGDVADAKYVQAITAAGDAVKAALGAREYLMSQE